MRLFRFKIARRRSRRASSVTKHYRAHKEAARQLILARLQYFNTHYGFQIKRVAIRNQRRCWGSCTSLGNLNFSYKLLFLPPELSDYVVVHELCHLKELNHSKAFWDLVAETLPDYEPRMKALKRYDHLHPYQLALMARAEVKTVENESFAPSPVRYTETHEAANH